MMVTVKSCIKAAVYVQFFHVSGRLLYKTGLCAAVVQLLAAYTVQSMHAESTPYVLYMTSHTIHNKMSQLQAATIIEERLMCRHAVAKVQLLFKGGFYTRLYGMCY